MRLIITIAILNFYIVSAQEIKNDIFGFATSNTFTYCDISDTSFTNKVVNINPQVLRFPGGAVGNFYHFGKSGYGFDYTEIDKYHQGKFPKRARGLDRYRRKINHNHDYIDDFILLAKKTNSKAVLVANPFVEDDEDILMMIQKITKNNIDIIGVELGSELSNRSYFMSGYTIDDYLIFAERCSRNIKKSFPNLKTAVIAAPLGKRKGHRHNIWNSRLAKLDFYDAIIIHSYAKVLKGKALDGQMVSEVVESQDKFRSFQIFKNRAINFLQSEYPMEVEHYYNIFNKPIWVTEWNLQISKTTGSTLLQSLFVAQFILELYSNSKLSIIELATYHNLGGRDIAGSIFRNNQNQLEIQSTYYPMKMIGEIFKNKIFRVEKEQFNEVFVYKCFDENKKNILTYTIDWKSNQLICKYEYTKVSLVYKSENLFDKANVLGILDFKTFDFYE